MQDSTLSKIIPKPKENQNQDDKNDSHIHQEYGRFFISSQKRHRVIIIPEPKTIQDKPSAL